MKMWFKDDLNNRLWTKLENAWSLKLDWLVDLIVLMVVDDWWRDRFDEERAVLGRVEDVRNSNMDELEEKSYLKRQLIG